MTSLPAGLGPQFSLLVSVLCLSLELSASGNSSLQGVPVTRYQADPDSFQREDCFCSDLTTTGLCLPRGYLSLESCYPDMQPPLAVSFPHGLHSPPSPLLTHTPAPDPSLHNIFLDVNTQLGLPLAMQVSFQLSAILRPDPSFPLVDKINQTRLVPLLWASEGFAGPDTGLVSAVKLVLALPAIISYGLPALITAVGGIILAIQLARRVRNSSESD